VEFASDEDQAVELARIVSLYSLKEQEARDKFVQDAQTLADQSKYVELLNTVLPVIGSLISDAPEKDSEPALLLLLAIAKKLPAESLQSAVDQFISTVSSNTNDKPQYRLKLLNHAYNIVNCSPAARFTLFKALLQFAVASHNELAVTSVHSDIERLSKTWNVSTEQLREVFKLMRDIFRNLKQWKQANDWTVKYFELFKQESDPALSATSEEAVRGVVEAISLPGLYSFDALLELLPVKRLEKANPAAFKLLNVFVSGTLEDFHSFSAAELEQFKAAGLDEVESVSKIRHLTLATLGSQSNQVPYATAAQALKVDASEVEAYVVNAISEGIIDARLDQLHRQINIARTIQRQFSRAQWVQLHDTLQAWKTNVRAILTSVESVGSTGLLAGPQH